MKKKNFNFNKLNSELLTLISLFAFFLLSVAYVGGPITTGKNLIRLINLAYPLIILIGVASIDLKKHIETVYNILNTLSHLQYIFKHF